MSLTVIQRFYELAKQEAEAPALGSQDRDGFHSLPWWFVKSKAKHFGIGLLEDGAQEGEYFYLFPSPHLSWIYAELGALTVGLQTVPLPPSWEPATMERLWQRYPPAFIFLHPETALRLQAALKNLNQLRRVILPGDLSFEYDTLSPRLSGGEGGVRGEKIDFEISSNIPCSNFRKIFNAGIRHESKHHATYRSRRQSLDEQRAMSPIRVNAAEQVVEQALHFGEVNELCASLSRTAGALKLRRLYANAVLSHTLVRIACLYWPIFLGMQVIFDVPSLELVEALRRYRPQAALFSGERLAELRRLFSEIGGDPKFSFPKGLWQRWLRRRRLGGRFNLLLTETQLPMDFLAVLEFLKIRHHTLQDI